MTMLSGGQPANMTGGTWGIVETGFTQMPAFTNSGSEAWISWSSEQTTAMKIGRKKLRLSFTQANGDVKAFPDLFVTVV